MLDSVVGLDVERDSVTDLTDQHTNMQTEYQVHSGVLLNVVVILQLVGSEYHTLLARKNPTRRRH